ncbi:MAG: helix-hairpin-helix domain-containing protein [Archaeoglobaceae archaeon]|nr:helix-hairpin-helix domain-containing protein [Archaeoglobaceae archaeon]MCX8152694.1 helix-hairpin-helix domain-containing protein [Archaeoglobaceae archaeon]MDW8013260.1 helix-hairpin-helix domain-containing protein [Archaeoglobaceae archaeon]
MILIDSREPEWIEEELKRYGLFVRRSSLKADYLIRYSSFEIAIERKEAVDFLNSIIDARLWQQVYSLKEEYKVSFLAIVGDLDEAINSKKFNRNAAIAATISIPLKTQGSVTVLQFKDHYDFCYALKILDEKITSGEIFAVPRVKKSNPQLAMLTAIPGVGEKLALKLLEKFGTIQRISNASLSELMRVEGVGEKRAKVIRDFFTKKFEEKEFKYFDVSQHGSEKFDRSS